MTVNRAGKRANLWVGGGSGRRSRDVFDFHRLKTKSNFDVRQDFNGPSIGRENSARFIFSAEKIEKRKTVILLM